MSLGRFFIRFRDTLAMLRTAYTSPEAVGTLANDILATTLVTSISRPGTTFIDVGSHIGSVISEVRFNDSSIKIIAIEAIPEKANRLKHYFPFAEIHSCAVGDKSGKVSFFIHTKNSGYSGLARPNGLSEHAAVEVTVPIELLDDIVQAIDIDVIKIDVEGAELGVLLGSTKLLDRSRPIIMFESPPPSSDGLGYSKEALYDFLNAKNYSILIPGRVAHDGPGLTAAGFLESHWYPRRTTNYFAIPNERRIEIRDTARSVLKLRPT